MTMDKDKDIVLIGVLKDRRDLNILLKKKWYRIPLLHAPRRKAEYIAFYQPSIFGRSGQRIRYYAKIRSCDVLKRKWILPEEPDHPRTDEDYYRINLEEIQKIPFPIVNKTRMRISFGFTTLEKLLRAETIAQLFDVPPIEEMLGEELAKKGISTCREFIFSLPSRKKYRLDFAVFCKKGPLGIECDGEKWHSIAAQKRKDVLRDRELKKEGWSILRLKEKDIINNLQKCVGKIERRIEKLGR